MTRTHSHRTLWRLLAALVVVAALAAALRPAGAQPGGPGREPLVPNIEPAGGGLAAADAPSEAEAVAAALAAYAALPQPAAPPTGAILDLPAAAALGAALSAANPVYLPLIVRSPASGEAPAPGGAPAPAPPTPAPAKPADVAVSLWAKPSIWVARGALLEYEIRLANYGAGAADGVDVVLPYYRGQYTLASTSLASKQGDWVSRIDQNSFTVHFGPLSDGARRSGKIFLRVGAALPYQTLLNVRALASGGGSGDGRLSNWAPVLVGSGPSDSPYVWVASTPDRGPAGATHRIFSNRFLPGEVVSTWLNTPKGVRALALRGAADAQGGVDLNYATTGLAKGSYQIVLYGNRSGLTGVASLSVQ